jgi:S-layer homology domain
MKKQPLVEVKDFTNHFSDVNSKTNSSLQAMVETALKYKITSTANKEFRPQSNVSRAEAYAMLMSSVCLKQTAKDTDWQKNVWQSAKTYGLTTRDLAVFEPTKPILTQELFTLATRIADWAEKTGGCTPRANACLLDYVKTLKPAVITVSAVEKAASA